MKNNVVPIYYCSFCGKNQDQVEVLIIAHAGSLTGLCNECVDLCNGIIAAKKEQLSEPTDGETK